MLKIGARDDTNCGPVYMLTLPKLPIFYRSLCLDNPAKSNFEHYSATKL